jgi:hypothetical protein
MNSDRLRWGTLAVTCLVAAFLLTFPFLAKADDQPALTDSPDPAFVCEAQG